MKTAVALDKLTVAEKLGVMEAIWDDLCRDESRVPSPAWHGEVLAGREARISSGEAKFSDWEQAKKRIRRRAV